MAKEKPINTKQLANLKQANAKLAAENKQLKKKLKTNKPKGSSWFVRTWRSSLLVLLIGAVGALLFVGNIFFWAGRTVTDTNRYVQTVEPLARDMEVQKAVSKYATTQLFNNVNVAEVAREALPPRAEFLAEPLAANLQQYTEQTLNKVVASDKFQELWVQSQTRAHEKLIAVAKSYEGDGTIDLNYLFQQLGQRLEDTKLSFLAGKTLPPKVGNIVVVEASWLPVFGRIINHIDLWQILATSLLFIFAALAVWLSKNRRRTIMLIGWTFVFVMLATLISFRIAREVGVAQVAPEYQAAARNAYTIIFRQLALNSVTILLLGLLIAVSAWMSGPAKGAKWVRDKTSLLFAGKLHEAMFSNKENAFTLWLGAHKPLVRWLIVVFVALLMLVVRLTPVAVLGYGLLIVVLITLLETLAAPVGKTKKPARK